MCSCAGAVQRHVLPAWVLVNSSESIWPQCDPDQMLPSVILLHSHSVAYLECFAASLTIHKFII